MGCSYKAKSAPLQTKASSYNINSNFDKKDFYMIVALDSEYRADYKNASFYYKALYQKSTDLKFAKEAIKLYILDKNFKELKPFIKEVLKKYPNNRDILRYQAAIYIDEHRYKEAKQIIKKLVKEDNDPKDRELLATINLADKHPKDALNYYRQEYKKTLSKESLIKLFDLLYFQLGKKEEAIKTLKSHIDFKGCDEVLCSKLILAYRDQGDVKSIINITKKLYNKNPKQTYVKMLLNLYKFNGDIDGALEFLETSKADNKKLIELYVAKKEYKKALDLAKKLYKESGDIDMLAKMAMMEYESSKIKNKIVLNSVAQKFDKVVKQVDDPLYDNYYGYLLIDHNIDPDRGIKLVKKALKQNPNSLYYIDSLAWGYYKKRECALALKTIEGINNLSELKEIQEHYKKIKACQ